MSNEDKKVNHLAGESSPYLLQHAKNPVDWYPWGDAAFSKARKEDKPIFLSIGYSSCHWCHVMAHESFEDEEIAGYLNDNFICIKVDREERPEIDHIYMQAVQALTGRGGWPLSVFLTPAGIPFFGGTYFPPENRHGMPGFSYVLKVMAQAYDQDKAEIEQHGVELQSALEQAPVQVAAEILTAKTLDNACEKFEKEFDSNNGGFGDAPKFPEATVLEFLMGSFARKRDRQILEMVELTLRKMAYGGLYDQLGGGFHRYSIDNQWRLPHFEKMLYDNAQLASIYLHAYQATHNELYKNIACETLDYLVRELRSKDGGFFSSQDADSEGMEGKFYTWTSDEINDVIGCEGAAKIGRYYGVTEAGNFEGRNVLYVTGHTDIDKDLLTGAKAEMSKVRRQRVKPNTDDKIIASWNGLAIRGLCEAAATLERKDYLKAAESCADFIVDKMVLNGKLSHTYSGGKAAEQGYLEDYAQVILGLLDLQAVSFSTRYLSLALTLSATMVDEFLNKEDGLLYDTPNSGEKLFVRPRNLVDSPVSSGNSAAVRALLYISALTGDRSYKEIAENSLRSIAQQMESFPRGFANWLCALDFYLSEGLELVIAGKSQTLDSGKFVHAVYSEYLPNKVVCSYDPGSDAFDRRVELIRDRGMIQKKTTVYICQRNTCLAPITDIRELSLRLKNLPAT
ncbi:MAG: thioredoxin domain-containing protein [Dehalococcoidia bacterium]